MKTNAKVVRIIGKPYMIKNIEWAILVEYKKDIENKTHNRNFVFETEKQALELKEDFRFNTK